MSFLVIFSHGQESKPWGTKIMHLAAVAKKHGAQVLSPDYSGMSDPNDRIAHLLSVPELASPDTPQFVLVGSSKKLDSPHRHPVACSVESRHDDNCRCM